MAEEHDHRRSDLDPEHRDLDPEHRDLDPEHRDLARALRVEASTH